MLDAVVGNTDRHHENWGLLVQQQGDDLVGMLAPTFDHASSLGRELQDEGAKLSSRRRRLSENLIANYSENARGAIYWHENDPQGLSPLELVRRASTTYPYLFAGLRESLEGLLESSFEDIIAKVPQEYMSELARTFAVRLLFYNVGELLKTLP